MPLAIARPIAIVAFVLCAMLVAVTDVHAQQAVPPGDQSATRQVIDEQIAAFRSGAHDRAYSYAAPNIKQVFPTVERFIGMVQGGYMPLYSPDSYVFGRSTLIGEQVLQEVIVTDGSGQQWQAIYTLVKQPDGSWKISGVKLDPYKGVSA